MKIKNLKDNSLVDEMDGFVRPDLSRIISNDSESNSVDISVSSMSGYWLDLDKECEPLDFLFAKQGDGVVERLLARGNIQLLKGQEKTGKSACGLMFITAALRGDEGFLEVRSQTPDLMNVLWVDTEQDESTLRAKGLKVCEMADIEHDDGRLHILPLRKHTVEKRLDLFSHALKEVGPDFVFLDGVADLCNNINDIEESTKVVSLLQDMAAETGCAMLCVIHANKTGMQDARGHLGTLLQQKCSEIYKMERKNNAVQACVKLEASRFAGVSDIRFKFGDDFALLPSDFSRTERASKTGNRR